MSRRYGGACDIFATSQKLNGAKDLTRLRSVLELEHRERSQEESLQQIQGIF